MTTLVNVHHKKPFDVWIGRAKGGGMHWGNPFSHLQNSRAAIIVPTRPIAVDCYDLWLDGRIYEDLEPERRLWILVHLPELLDKVLGCVCDPLECHGHRLIRRLYAYKAFNDNFL